MNPIAVVYSSKGPAGCDDTALALAVLYLQLGGIGPGVEFVKPGSLRATELWNGASGMFDQTLLGHHPLVCVLSDDGSGKIVSAAVEPDLEKLTKMLAEHGIQIYGMDELPETFTILARRAKPVATAG